MWVMHTTSDPEPTSLISSNLSPIALDASPNDFTISPDFQTIYITDGANVNPPAAKPRAESSGLTRDKRCTYQLQYTIPTTTQPGQTGNDGPDGLLVDFSAHSPTWGQGVTAGAVIYATTGSATWNYLIRIVDTNGAGPPPLSLLSPGSNQGLRGIRFGLTTVPVGISQQPVSGHERLRLHRHFHGWRHRHSAVPLSMELDGTNIASATGSSLVLSNVVAANAYTYSVTVGNAIPSKPWQLQRRP